MVIKLQSDGISRDLEVDGGLSSELGAEIRISRALRF
jgi:hypothetical protein